LHPPTLIIMAKRPAAGQTKTRLCPPLSPALAAELYEALLRDTLDLARRVPGVRPSVAYAPADAEGYFAALAPDVALWPQVGDGLGERLAAVTEAALAAGAPAVAVMSSDSPGLPPAYVAQAFATLDEGADLALGPAEDGGYYLAALRRPAPRLFREVTMSTPTVLQDTLAVAADLGLRAALLPPWYDVDTVADLRRLRDDAAPLTATRQVLARLPRL
jgi:rSAM/selenodomain-associated transferase 1